MNKIKSTGLVVSLLFFVGLASCRREMQQEGYVAVEGGNIWYTTVGKGGGTPLLILHGGPGGRSCGMIPGFSRLSAERPVIFYDQLGSGNSDRPNDTTLWTTGRFVNEIDALRKALDLEELHILGHSCGSTFLIEYLVTKKPKGVRSVIFSSPMISTPDWIADARKLLAELPAHVRDTLYKYEALKEYTAPAYQAATDSFYARHLVRREWPYKSPACANYGPSNDSIYNYMWGPTEFTATGTLLDFDRTDKLQEIEAPILFMAGEYDEARPETMYRYQNMAKNATVEIIENAAHSTMVDQPEKVAEVINRFLKQVESH